mmetsp:Transcript_37553/g.82389  ORF Transcript_37553/g.82389 Transcript_37553/m.82389 type:complete len:88 (-) Transcript_37553:290-553(-)
MHMARSLSLKNQNQHLASKHFLTVRQRWMNCIALMEPRKKTAGTAMAWIASQRKVKIGYATGVLAVAGFCSALQAVPLRKAPAMAAA